MIGTTASQDFPTNNAFQPQPGGGEACDLGECLDAFVTVIAEESGIPIAITSNGGTSVISWPDTGRESILETTGSLSPPVVWSPEGTPPTSGGGQKRVTVQSVGSTRFYRLRTP